MLLPSCFLRGRASVEPVTLRFARWARIEDARQFQEMIRQFEQENPDIRVEAEYLSRDAYLEKLSISLQTGDAPDVFMMSSTMTPLFVPTNAPLLRLDTLDVARALSAFPARIKAPITFYGGTYAMPIGLGIRAMMYDRNALRRAGIPFPSETEAMTWDEFIALLLRLKKTEPGLCPLRMDPYLLMETMLNSHDSPLFGDMVSQNTSTINRERATEAFGVLERLYAGDLLPRGSAEEIDRRFGNYDNAICTGNVAFMYSGLWSLPLLSAAGVDYGTMPLPRARQRAPSGEISYMLISRDSAKRDAAWRMVEWFATKAQRYMGTGGDYPANDGYDPIILARNAQNGLYRTFSSEKQALVPLISIRNENIQRGFRESIEGIVTGKMGAAQAVDGLIEVMGASIEKGFVRE
jgi:ABC-type glycerol-3-phosphate transport system substrate-binding protein